MLAALTSHLRRRSATKTPVRTSGWIKLAGHGFSFMSCFGVMKKITDRRCYFRIVSLESEVPGIEKAHLGIGDVTLKRFSASRQKERIVSSPHGQKRRLVFSKVGLKFQIHGNVILVI